MLTGEPAPSNRIAASRAARDEASTVTGTASLTVPVVPGITVYRCSSPPAFCSTNSSSKLPGASKDSRTAQGTVAAVLAHEPASGSQLGCPAGVDGQGDRDERARWPQGAGDSVGGNAALEVEDVEGDPAVLHGQDGARTEIPGVQRLERPRGIVHRRGNETGSRGQPPDVHQRGGEAEIRRRKREQPLLEAALEEGLCRQRRFFSHRLLQEPARLQLEQPRSLDARPQGLVRPLLRPARVPVEAAVRRVLPDRDLRDRLVVRAGTPRGW